MGDAINLCSLALGHYTPGVIYVKHSTHTRLNPQMKSTPHRVAPVPLRGSEEAFYLMPVPYYSRRPVHFRNYVTLTSIYHPKRYNYVDFKV
jgi:hypothetical protein